MRVKSLLLVLLLAFVVSGCRGQRAEKPPVHLNPNMDYQARYNPQALSRDLPEGTLPWGAKDSLFHTEKRDDYLKSNTAYYFGKNADGSWVKKVPTEVTAEVINRGQERYDIYCSVCHDKSGSGKGLVIERGFVPAPSFHEQRVLDMTDGYIFDVISNGVRNMPAYGKQIPEADRWAIVTYVRSLQKVKSSQYSEAKEYIRSELK
jgi:mono/diheme cytochrome c family protein